ncbi:MAG TPA: bifunctional DNA primase/polymerase [Polyangiaceae bacterium]|nr:bifunctional DNA primase/polymerase [Polyangiaceae bacterium]
MNAPREAEVLELETWRAPDGELRRAIRHGWHDLEWIGQTDKQDAIRIYARQGLHPILLHGVTGSGGCTCMRVDCSAPGKHPVHAGWQRATLALDELDRALERNWRLNIGLRMGRQPSGVVLVCIDVDGPRELLAPLERENGPLPPTLTARSGKGMHLIFKMPDGMAPPKNRVRLAPGIDVRAEGGQIVAAPSRHVTGRVYRWLEVREPAELPS